MFNMLTRLVKEEQGQGMVEYSLILALISIIAIVAITGVGGKIGDIWTSIKTKLDAVSTT